MASFDISEAECANEKDREMICDAIADKFGSVQAFEDFLRGAARTSVMATARQRNVTYIRVFGLSLALSWITHWVIPFGFASDVLSLFAQELFRGRYTLSSRSACGM